MIFFDICKKLKYLSCFVDKLDKQYLLKAHFLFQGNNTHTQNAFRSENQ